MKKFMSMILMVAVVVTSVVVPNANNVETVKAAEVDAGVAQVVSGAAISAPITAPTKTETGAYEGYETYIDWMKSCCTHVVSLDAEVYAIDWSDAQHKKYHMSYREYLTKNIYVIPEEYTMVMVYAGDKLTNITSVPPLIMCKPDGTEAIVYTTNGYDSNGNGYDRDGYDKRGYDFWGYDREGYSYWGYDREDYDREGYDAAGYDRNGYNKNGYDRDGVKDEKDIMIGFLDKGKTQMLTNDSNKLKWTENFKKKLTDENFTTVFVKRSNGNRVLLDVTKLTLKKVSKTSKCGCGVYNLKIDCEFGSSYNFKIVVGPSSDSYCGVDTSKKEIRFTACDVGKSMSSSIDGVQYTIGKVKNSKSTKFIKTYKKKTSKKFNKKITITDTTSIKKAKRNETICIKYREYALTSDNKKIYSEWMYVYKKLK